MGRYRGTNPDYDAPSSEEDAYPPGELAPPQPAGMQSQQQSLSLAAGLSTRPPSAAQLARWITPEQFPRDLTLHLDVRGTSAATATNPFAQQATAFAQGDGQSIGTELGGVLRLSFGAGNVLRVVEADLRSGSYHVPACTTATVEAFLYGTGPATVTIGVSLVPGKNETPARLLNSMRITLAAGATRALKVPFGARWVSLSGGGATGVGAAQPQLALYGTIGPTIVQDWLNSVFIGTPGQFVELVDRGDLTLKNNGTASATAIVRFALEI